MALLTPLLRLQRYLLPLILCASLLSGCKTSHPAAAGDAAADRELASRIDASLTLASRYLIDHQSEDGAWRSKVYGPLRDGPSLTPHVTLAMYFLSNAGANNAAGQSFQRGKTYLAAQTELADENAPSLRYPVYTAAVSGWIMGLGGFDPDDQSRQKRWLNLVRAHQLDERLGWSPEDPAFGGFGYSILPPRKPIAGTEPPPLYESNLSATAYGLGALRAAGVPLQDPAYQRILKFAFRCQNFSDEPSKADHRFDDGGFYFIPDDAAKNKAGIAGTDTNGRTRYHSYGAATADGLRILLHAGLPPDHPRVVAARRWLEKNFDPAHNPGVFEPDREVLRDATYFYYVWSVAHAFMHAQERDGKMQDRDWARGLAGELLRRQRADGAWSNAFTDTKEDDPLVATPHAVAALKICKSVLTGRRVTGHNNITPERRPRSFHAERD